MTLPFIPAPGEGVPSLAPDPLPAEIERRMDWLADMAARAERAITAGDTAEVERVARAYERRKPYPMKQTAYALRTEAGLPAKRPGRHTMPSPNNQVSRAERTEQIMALVTAAGAKGITTRTIARELGILPASTSDYGRRLVEAGRVWMDGSCRWHATEAE